MGLDACVHCNCFETGKLNTDPPEPERVLLMEDGSLDYQCDNLEQTMAFDRWLRNDACSHRNGILFHHYLRNISLVAFVRKALGRDKATFPILLEKVVYSGIHAGDWLDFETVLRLEKEVTKLSSVVVEIQDEPHWLDEFRDKLYELIDAAKSVRKPIAF